MSTTSALPANSWTKLNINLHWLVVALLVAQYVDGGWMIEFFDSGIENTVVPMTTVGLGYLHMALGLTVLTAVLLRLWDRYAHGRPEHAATDPNWATILAKVTHFGIYAVVISMPIAGLITWLTSNEWLGDMHAQASDLLLVLLALHVGGALVNHFHFKNNVLKRMMPGQGR
jgi:cytochrome b561